MLAPGLNRDAVLITSDPRSAAYISSFFARSGVYFVVMSVPWLPDPLVGPNEVVRCNNILARVQPRILMLGAMGDREREFLARRFRALNIMHLPGLQAAIDHLGPPDSTREPLLHCEDGEIPVVLWRCLRHPGPPVPDIICMEPYDPIEDISVANLAIAVGADLAYIDLPEEESRAINEEEEFLRSARAGGQPMVGRMLGRRLATRQAALGLPRYKSATFVTKSTPHGLVAPSNVITAHTPHFRGLSQLFTNAILYEIDEVSRTYMSLIFDPGFFPDTEAEPVADLFGAAGWNVKRVTGPGCRYEAFDLHIQFFPNDVLLTATHGGEVPGEYVIWRFRDSKGVEHTFECEEVLIFSHVGVDDKVRVTTLTVPVRIDGIFWDDEEGKRELDAGDLLRQFVDLHRTPKLPAELVLQNRYDLPRVGYSNAIALHNGAFHFLGVHSLGHHEHPLVFNNACSSWAELGKKVMFAGARAYVCTARAVENPAAKEVAVGFFRAALGGTALAEALWSASYDVPRARGVYVFAGLPFATLKLPPRGVDIRKRWGERAQQIEASLRSYLNREADARMGLDLKVAMAFIRAAIREV